MIRSLPRWRLATLVSLLLCVALPAHAEEWRTYGNGGARLFFNAAESTITAANLDRLGIKWRFRAGKIVTAQPSVAEVDLAGEGLTPMVFIQSWDRSMYALRLADGSEVWSFETDEHPGASFPNVGSVHVENVGGTERIFFGAGETLYCLDAATGAEVWRFHAGTGCTTPPGLCDFAEERNEIETSPIIVDGMVVFGMDVNDRETGKGGAYAVDVDDGRMLWFFDLETGGTCVPDPGDDIRNFDGYHSESELGLPSGFLSSRSGCDFDRSSNGCGNIWASPAADEGRELLYFASSNCDTDFNAGTNRPEPPMPPYDEALFALNFDGTAAWRWRPREVDNADLAFGATPQLFTINTGGMDRDVVGIGNKDGTYYVIDRDGINEVSLVAWDDLDPSTLPYWTKNLVDGGFAGGITGTPAIDVAAGAVYISTAPGVSPASPQQPTVHALNLDDGSILWQNTAESIAADASFAPTTAVPGLVFVGSVIGNNMRIYNSATGERLAVRAFPSSVASGPSIVDGTMLLGHGIGELSADTMTAAYVTAQIPSDVTAMCIVGAAGCPARLAGKKIVFKDDLAEPSKRKIVVLAKDENAIAPEPGSADDPTLFGATLTVENPDSTESQTFNLPASGWSGLGNPKGIKGYKYKDSDQINSACKAVNVKAGKLVKAKCNGSGITFDLNEPTQGKVGFSLDTGTGGEWRWCALFGGTVLKDEGTDTTGDKAQFKAKSADRPASCP